MYLSKLFNFVLYTISKYNIDESHGITHSMNVLHNCCKLIDSVIDNNPYIDKQRKIIYGAAILHDMCDKKYMKEETGMKEIRDYIYTDMSSLELHVMESIIVTMSYSKVKKDGFPDFGEHYQMAYHIVREADLLAAYDFDRCMIYDMCKRQTSLEQAFKHASSLFEDRMFKHQEDGLLLLPYSIEMHPKLTHHARIRIDHWKRLLRSKL